jgi:hypothetical protein
MPRASRFGTFRPVMVLITGLNAAASANDKKYTIAILNCHTKAKSSG